MSPTYHNGTRLQRQQHQERNRSGTAGAGEEMNPAPECETPRTSSETMEGSLIHRIDLNMLWWAGVGMTIFGGAAYLL